MEVRVATYQIERSSVKRTIWRSGPRPHGRPFEAIHEGPRTLETRAATGLTSGALPAHRGKARPGQMSSCDARLGIGLSEARKSVIKALSPISEDGSQPQSMGHL
jgi:hypothetical protein